MPCPTAYHISGQIASSKEGRYKKAGRFGPSAIPPCSMSIIDPLNGKRAIHHAEDDIRSVVRGQNKARHAGGKAVHVRIPYGFHQLSRKDPICPQRHKFLSGSRGDAFFCEAHIQRICRQIRQRLQILRRYGILDLGPECCRCLTVNREIVLVAARLRLSLGSILRLRFGSRIRRFRAFLLSCVIEEPFYQ